MSKKPKPTRITKSVRHRTARLWLERPSWWPELPNPAPRTRIFPVTKTWRWVAFPDTPAAKRRLDLDGSAPRFWVSGAQADVAGLGQDRGVSRRHHVVSAVVRWQDRAGRGSRDRDTVRVLRAGRCLQGVRGGSEPDRRRSSAARRREPFRERHRSERACHGPVFFFLRCNAIVFDAHRRRRVPESGAPVRFPGESVGRRKSFEGVSAFAVYGRRSVKIKMPNFVWAIGEAFISVEFPDKPVYYLHRFMTNNRLWNQIFDGYNYWSTSAELLGIATIRRTKIVIVGGLFVI